MNLMLIIQVCFIIIFIGVIYSLWRTTRAYGGVVGVGLKWIGLGIIFFCLEALDRLLGSYGFLGSLLKNNSELVHNGFLLLGLIFSGIGFSQLMKYSK